jgi:PAS domain S-box-containing protein
MKRATLQWDGVPGNREDELQRAAFQYAPIAMAHVDLDGRLLWANEHFDELLGYSAAELNGALLDDVSHPDDAGADVTNITLLVQGKTPRYVSERRLLRRDGSSLWVQLSVALCGAGHPGPPRLLCVLTDVTEQKLFIEDLQRENTALQRKNRELRDYTYSLAHELRTPLRILAGYIELLPEHCSAEPNPEFKRLFGVIETHSRRLKDMVEALLRLAQYDHRELEYTEVDMTALARETADFHMLHQDRRGIEIEIGELPKVHGDRALLRHVWDNLISNALKYTRPRASSRIEVSGETDGASKVFRVRDNGVGFEQKYADEIFRPFQRVCPAEFEGLGVGLALVDKIVQRHGGSVEAQGEPDVGATFSFWLPCDADAQRAAEHWPTRSGIISPV